MTSSPIDWSGRVVVVTGAASGIGAATAQRFHVAGAHVVAIDMCQPPRLGERGSAVVGDVASAATWAEALETCSSLGRLDVLVSNAARVIVAPLTELEPAEWDAQVAVNLTGSYYALRALLPMLQQCAGRVVMVSSVQALVGLPGHPAYAATKSALTGLARQLAVDYPSVRVNCVLPGPILTPMWDGVDDAGRARSIESTVLKRLGEPDEVAAAIEFLASDAASYITGASLVVDGGQTITRDTA